MALPEGPAGSQETMMIQRGGMTATVYRVLESSAVDGVVRATNVQLADWAGCSERAVRYALTALVDAGLVVRRFTSSGDRELVLVGVAV